MPVRGALHGNSDDRLLCDGHSVHPTVVHLVVRAAPQVCVELAPLADLTAGADVADDGSQEDLGLSRSRRQAAHQALACLDALRSVDHVCHVIYWPSAPSPPLGIWEHADGEHLGTCADVLVPKGASFLLTFLMLPSPSVVALGVRRRHAPKK